MQAEVIREGELEKRSDSLFQLWKKKLVVLTKDSLSLFPDGHKRAKGKELGFGSILKVDCVERTGKYIYFTIVTKDRKEIDFRCPDQSCWNASITMALIDFQNKRAIQDFKSHSPARPQVSPSPLCSVRLPRGRPHRRVPPGRVFRVGAGGEGLPGQKWHSTMLSRRIPYGNPQACDEGWTLPPTWELFIFLFPPPGAFH